MFVLPTSIARSMLVSQLSALSSFTSHRTSPATTRSTFAPTRTSSAPCRSMSCARPRTTPAGESHSTSAPGRDGASCRQALRIASNLPARRSAYRSPIAARISASINARSAGRVVSASIDVTRDASSRRICGRLQIHAEPDDDELEHARLHGRLRENASELAAADQHIVRPLDLRRQSGHGAHRFGNCDAAGERQQGGGILVVVQSSSVAGRSPTHTALRPAAKTRRAHDVHAPRSAFPQQPSCPLRRPTPQDARRRRLSRPSIRASACGGPSSPRGRRPARSLARRPREHAARRADCRPACQAGSMSKLMSTAGAEWVSAPTETKSAPVAASSGMRASVTPPDISVFARPRLRRTASRMSSIVMLSSSRMSAPASSA